MIKYLISAALLALGVYGFIEAWPLIEGPALTIDSPGNYMTFPGGIVLISGKALRAAELTLDGAPLLRDQDGSFSSTLTFPAGGSILTFAARDRFGKRTSVMRSIFVP
jgi:hypothetical protein